MFPLGCSTRRRICCYCDGGFADVHFEQQQASADDCVETSSPSSSWLVSWWRNGDCWCYTFLCLLFSLLTGRIRLERGYCLRISFDETLEPQIGRIFITRRTKEKETRTSGAEITIVHHEQQQLEWKQSNKVSLEQQQQW